MIFELQDIGIPTIQGKRIPIRESVLGFLVDSNIDFQLVVLARNSQGHLDIIGVMPGGPIEKQRHQNSISLTIYPDRLDRDMEYTIGAYATSGDIGDILLTIIEPRMYQALRFPGAKAILLGRLCFKAIEWEYEFIGSPCENGLSDLMA